MMYITPYKLRFCWDKDITGKRIIYTKDIQTFICFLKWKELHMISRMAHLLKEELLSFKPYTHNTHDREIIRIRKFIDFLKLIEYEDKTPEGIMSIKLYRWEIEELEQYVEVIETFKGYIKKIRLKIRNFMLFYIIKILQELEDIRVVLKLDKTKFELRIYNGEKTIYREIERERERERSCSSIDENELLKLVVENRRDEK